MARKKTQKDMGKIKNKKVIDLMNKPKEVPKKSIFGIKPKDKIQHLFRDDKVDVKKKEGWKVLDTPPGGLTLMEKEI